MVNRSSSAKEAETEKIPQAEVAVCIKNFQGKIFSEEKKEFILLQSGKMGSTERGNK